MLSALLYKAFQLRLSTYLVHEPYAE